MRIIRFALFLALVALVPSCTATVPKADTSASTSDSPANDKLQEPVALGGWGPARPTFTSEVPPNYVALNSLTESSWGDERNFLQVKSKEASNSEYTDDLNVSVGKTYTAIFMYRNAASSKVITPSADTTVRVMAPSSIKGAGEINAFLTASNANPREVWDSAVIRLDKPTSEVALRYVPGTAVVHTAGQVNDLVLPDELYTSGTPIGCNKLDGQLKGRDATCTGYVTFDFTLDQPNFIAAALGASAENNELSPSVTAHVGDIIEMRAEYKNTGTTVQNDVVMDLNLPAGMEVVSGSMKVANGSSTHTYKPVTDETAGMLLAGRFNIGDYNPGAACYIKFAILIKDVPGHDFTTTGQVYRYPEIFAHTGNGSKGSVLKVQVWGPLQ